MGEREECVFPYGCPSADVVYNSKLGSLNTSLNTFLNMGVGPDLDLSSDYLLVLFHPVTTEYSSSEEQMNELLNAVKRLNMQTVLIWPNIDAGADGVSQAIRIFREDNNQIKLRAYKNFEPEEYIPLLDNAVCAVGNSSSFIRDASFLGTPIVLIGSRQNGREYSDAVTHVKPDSVDIFNAVKKQIKHGKYQASTLYGKYGVSNKIVNKILTLNKYVQKKFHIID
jgi:UDP-hydrolysing UDP-N-acetyl-D-glucosamine 2-epimerase